MLEEKNQKQEYQKIYKDEISDEDSRNITSNLVGFFHTLIEIDKKNNVKIPSINKEGDNSKYEI